MKNLEVVCPRCQGKYQAPFDSDELICPGCGYTRPWLGKEAESKLDRPDYMEDVEPFPETPEAFNERLRQKIQMEVAEEMLGMLRTIKMANDHAILVWSTQLNEAACRGMNPKTCPHCEKSFVDQPEMGPVFAHPPTPEE